MLSYFVNVSVVRIIMPLIAEKCSSAKEGWLPGIWRSLQLPAGGSVWGRSKVMYWLNFLKLGLKFMNEGTRQKFVTVWDGLNCRALTSGYLGDGEGCSQSCSKNYSVLAERTPGVVDKISADKSFSLSSLVGCSKAVRLTLHWAPAHFPLLAGCYHCRQAPIWSSWFEKEHLLELR